MSDTGRLGRWALALVGAALTALLFGFYVVQATAVERLRPLSSTALLASPPAERGKLPATDSPLLRRAIAADPLDAALVNVLTVAATCPRCPAHLSDAGFAQLRQLGWRHSPALQNLIYQAAQRERIAAIGDIADALLRRGRAIDQARTLLNLLESDPSLRADVVRRLRARPPWRLQYLNAVGSLNTPELREGHAQTLLALQRAGDRLERAELAPFLNLLVQSGEPGPAFAIWRGHQPKVGSPLDDNGFNRAAQAIRLDQADVPFEWRPGTDAGASVDISQDDGGAGLVVDWNGRGVPIFVSQVSSVPDGARPSLRIVADSGADGARIAEAVGARLICPSGLAANFLDPRLLGRVVALSADRPSPCAFPRFELTGRVRRTTEPVHVEIRRLELR